MHSSYYIHGPWRAKRNFCCFICVSYGPYTLLQNDSFCTFIFAVLLLNLFYRCILLHKPIYCAACDDACVASLRQQLAVGVVLLLCKDCFLPHHLHSWCWECCAVCQRRHEADVLTRHGWRAAWCMLWLLGRSRHSTSRHRRKVQASDWLS